MRNFILIILFFILVAFDNNELILKSRAEVKNDVIRLEDIVLQSNMPKDVYKKIKTIPIRRFSQEDTFLNITTDFIQRQLRFYEYNDIKIIGGICTVYKQKSYIRKEQIITLAKKTILSHLGEKEENCNISIKNVPKIIVPDEEYQIFLNVANEIKRSGLIYLAGEIKSQKTIVNRFKIMANVEIFKEVVTLKVPKRRGERIFEEDVVIDRKKVLDLKNTCFDKTEVIGKNARKYLPRGKVITFDDIKKSPDVKRGQKVDVEVVSGPILLSYEAISKQNGYVGDIVKCQNPASKEIFYAEIVDHNKLVISLGEK